MIASPPGLGFRLSVQLKHWRYDLRLAHTWTIARGSGTDIFPVVLLQLTGSDGAIGLGESAPVARYQESVQTVMAFCDQVDPRKLSFADIPGSMKYLDTLAPGNMSAKCAINIALVDGAARQAGKPLCDYLGLGFRESQHLTSFSIGIDKPEVIRQKVLAAENYPVLKLKLGSPDDKLNLGALREAAPHKPVRVDANEGWPTKEKALAMIEWLAGDGHIQFVEQPMPAASDPREMAWLKERSPLPLFGDESFHTAADAAQCAECFHGVNIKLGKTAGVSGGYAALQAARRAGLQTMIGCMIETSVLISAAAHLAELANHLDLDGNLLTTNDPYLGVTAEKGILSFAHAPGKTGLRVKAK
ncbi:MAG: L-Ala-D/L-amino acid epimerase [Pedosphaera sp.]|nr:L-Ala-D/L-amino acid epimerase [Pedosphaera sp.]